MRKIFTFGILFLLSFMATTSFASGKAAWESAATTTELPKFSSDNGSDETWYYIRFVRAANVGNYVWACNDTTPRVVQDPMILGEQGQHWKVVGNRDECYIVNRLTGKQLLHPNGATVTPDEQQWLKNTHYYLWNSDALNPPVKLAFQEYTGGNAAVYGNGWQLMDLGKPHTNPESFGFELVNDQEGDIRFLCNYWRANDNGSIVQFIPTEEPGIYTTAGYALCEVPVGQTGTAQFSVSVLHLTSISAEISGPDANFFKATNTLTAAGTQMISFTPTEDREYNATITYTGTNTGTGATATLTVPLEGKIVENFPMISTEDDSDEHWYYIQFYNRRSSNSVWAVRNTTPVIVQESFSPAKDEQQWKFWGTWETGFVLVNKTGTEIILNNRMIDGIKVPRIEGYSVDYYIQADSLAMGSMGDSFDFRRFPGTTDWQLYNRDYEGVWKHVNDRSGSWVGSYSGDDGGNRLLFISAKDIFVDNSFTLEAPVTERITKTIPVGGANLTEGITATLDSDSDVFSFGEGGTDLPPTGGNLNIVFIPKERDSYTATLTLTSGSLTKEVTLIGNSDFDALDKNMWYFIQFNRKPNTVWAAVPDEENGRYGTRIRQEPFDEEEDGEDYDKHWRLAGGWDSGYRIINRNGGAMFYDDDGTEFNRYLLIEQEGFGDLHLFYRQNTTSGWQLQNKEGKHALSGSDRIYMNDHGGTPGDSTVNLYLINDAGNIINFIPVGAISSIECPSTDPNDAVIAVKYYTVWGVEVTRPSVSGIYIMRNTHASGRFSTTKKLITVR